MNDKNKLLCSRLFTAADDEALLVEIYAECKHLLSTSVIPSAVFIQRGREREREGKIGECKFPSSNTLFSKTFALVAALSGLTVAIKRIVD